MRTVKINKDKLLTKVKENREKHIAEFKTAHKIYVEDAIAKLQSMLDKAKTTGKIDQYVGLNEPQSFETSYNTVISMLEFSTDTEVELSQSEFQQYVEDQWQWKGAFTATNSTYISKVA